MGHALVGRLVNKVTNFSQLQSSVQGGKTQAYRSYVEFFQRCNGGCSEDKVLPYLSSGPLAIDNPFAFHSVLKHEHKQSNSASVAQQPS